MQRDGEAEGMPDVGFDDLARAAWVRARAALREAAALLLPVVCAGCLTPDVALCEPCRDALRRQVAESGTLVRTTGGVRVHSAFSYDEAPIAAILAAYKERGRTSLAHVLGSPLRQAVDDVAVAAGAAAGTFAVVPVPATPASIRRRGYRPVELVMARAGLAVCRGLRVQGAPDDQRQLSASERAANVTGAFRPRGRTLRDVEACVIVDDVVTTGATIRAAAAALAVAGVRVLGAATIAQTPRRRNAG